MTGTWPGWTADGPGRQPPRAAWLGRNVLRRLLAKRFGAPPPGDGRWTIAREMWSTDAPACQGNGRHDRTEPWGLQGPVLMARGPANIG